MIKPVAAMLALCAGCACADWTIKAGAPSLSTSQTADQSFFTKYAGNPIITTNYPSDSNAVYELSPVVPTNGIYTGNTNFYGLFSAGWGYYTCGVWLASSPDGTNWSRTMTRPVWGAGNGYTNQSSIWYSCRPFVMQHTNGMFYGLCENVKAGFPGGDGLALFSSSDLTNWTNHGEIITPTRGGNWEDAIANSSMWCEMVGTQELWRIIYEAANQGSSTYHAGLAWAYTSGCGPTGLTFLKSANCLDFSQGAGSVSHPSVYHQKFAGAWHCFYHSAPSGVLPTYPYHRYSYDLTNWISWPTGDKLFGFTQTAWEGTGTSSQQVGTDPKVVERNGSTYFFYDAGDNNYNGTGALYFRCGVAISTNTLASLLYTSTNLNPSVVSVTAGNPAVVDPVSSWTTIANLVSQWTMNDNAANTTVADTKGTNPGTSVRNTSTLTTSGKINSALTFSRASSDKVDVGSGSSLNLSGDLTITAWINVSTTDGDINTIFAKSSASSPYDQYQLAEQTGSIYFRVRNTSATVFDATKASAGTGQWQFVCAVASGTVTRVYVNGVAGNNTTITGTRATVTASTKIGMLHSGYPAYFRGTIDDTRIYNRALTQAEITALYAGGAGTEAE